MTRAGLAAVALVLLAVASVLTGVGDLTPARLFSDPGQQLLLFVSRLPRTAAALLTGAAMAVAGVDRKSVV